MYYGLPQKTLRMKQMASAVLFCLLLRADLSTDRMCMPCRKKKGSDSPAILERLQYLLHPEPYSVTPKRLSHCIESFSVRPSAGPIQAAR